VTEGQCLQANLIFLWFVSFDQAKEMNKSLFNKSTFYLEIKSLPLFGSDAIKSERE
jgi:hypothetical protein